MASELRVNTIKDGTSNNNLWTNVLSSFVVMPRHGYNMHGSYTRCKESYIIVQHYYRPVNGF